MFIYRIICCSALLLIAGCGKKDKREQLAKTYFKMAYLELAEKEQTHATQQEALQLIEKALQEHTTPQYLAFKATILLQMGYPKESNIAFEQALAITKDEAVRTQIMNNYACLLAQQGNQPKAKKIWQDLASNPWYQTPEVAWVNLGRLHMEEKQPSLAKEAFNTAALMAPNYLDAHYYCAIAAFESGDRGLAQQELESVLRLEPEHQGAKLLMNKFESRV